MTKRGFVQVVGHSARGHGSIKKRQDSSCATGGFYTAPTQSQTIDASQALAMTWDNTCLPGTASADIYLYAPSLNESRLQIWQGVDFTPGSYSGALTPDQWSINWNTTSSVQLQLIIVPSGTPPIFSTLPAGPIFSGTYTPSPTSTATAQPKNTNGPIVTVVDNFLKTVEGLPGGDIAAAVLIPLIVIGLAIFGYIRWSRKKQAAKKNRFSQKIDKRMSTISTDWKSLSPAGAEAAIRHSMAVSAARASTFSVGGRPSSTFAVESGQAGIGSGNSMDNESPDMTQIRTPGVGPRSLGASDANRNSDRVSRISFAADTRFSRVSVGGRSRPSGDARRAGAATRSFHTAIIPPVPERPSIIIVDSEQDEPGVGTISPTQREGPISLSPADIHARLSGRESVYRPSLDDVMPALSMMRTGSPYDQKDPSISTDDLLLSPPPAFSPISPPAYSYPSTPAAVHSPGIQKSPIVDAMPMPSMAAIAMSPDAMMRAYAERNLSPSTPSFPNSATGGLQKSNTMRTLYSPVSPIPYASIIPDPLPVAATNNPFRKSMAVELYRHSGVNQDGNDSAYAQ